MTLIHRTIEANGMRLHCVEQGEGPLVLLVHGFPESWYSWRHQLPAIAEAGYRAVALDVRGYGRSSKPHAVGEYSMLRLAGDVVHAVGALGESEAILVGHDWGAPIVWNSALVRPDLFRGVAGLSVPYSARSGKRPSRVFSAIAGPDAEFYIDYFQEPGRAEAEIEKDVRQWLLGFYWGASGGPVPNQPPIFRVPHGTELRDTFVYPETMPDWLSEEDLDFYTAEFERSGFRGPLNRYRNVDRDWVDMTAFHQSPIVIPSMFLGGEFDGPTLWGATAIERFSESLPQLRFSRIVPGVGHWIQQEAAEETNAALLEFFATL
ncbi:MAG: alpha/beta hydrolase [Acidobacteriota bacterium]